MSSLPQWVPQSAEVSVPTPQHQCDSAADSRQQTSRFCVRRVPWKPLRPRQVSSAQGLRRRLPLSLASPHRESFAPRLQGPGADAEDAGAVLSDRHPGRARRRAGGHPGGQLGLHSARHGPDALRLAGDLHARVRTCSGSPPRQRSSWRPGCVWAASILSPVHCGVAQGMQFTLMPCLQTANEALARQLHAGLRRTGSGQHMLLGLGGLKCQKPSTIF